MLILWLFGFLSVWIISLMVWLLGRDSLINRWLSAVFFVGGLGPFNYFLGDLLLPQLELYFSIDQHLSQSIYFFSCVLSAIAHYFSPYCFLMFGLAFAGVFSVMSRVKRRLIYAAFLIPIAIMCFIIPVYPHQSIHFVYLCIWVVPYIIASSVLMTVSFLKERIDSGNNVKLLIWILTIPLAYMGLYTSYVTRALGYAQIYKITIWIPIILFIVVILFLFKYGLWGIRLRIERQIADGSMKAISIGAQMLIHAIKNELAKISISLTNARSTIDKTEVAAAFVDSDFRAMSASIDSIYKIVQKIREQAAEIKLHEIKLNLFDVVGKAIAANNGILATKNILCINTIPANVWIVFDPFHLEEVLNNCILNSFEALKNQGSIEFSYKNNSIRIRDNGEGIRAQDIRSVFSPFFSTKSNPHGFGLGLTYCYMVMQEHGGKIDVQSYEGFGTTVVLKFAGSKVQCK